MSLRKAFVRLAQQKGANRCELCRRFGITPQTAYKWLARYKVLKHRLPRARLRRDHL
ncbi:transposase-like protein [Azomonas macrocytogenes]|uniref:Transposase-like protein n=1 Tax=Azomonas macrocytogenes TaxID=69962 RepID=A0A839T5Z6_AZOMA|nr:transposase-like protein [Azomonas macrocytogenes]